MAIPKGIYATENPESIRTSPDWKGRPRLSPFRRAVRTEKAPQVLEDIASDTVSTITENVPVREFATAATLGAAVTLTTPSISYAGETQNPAQIVQTEESESQNQEPEGRPHIFYETLSAQIKRHEGFESRVYNDSVGIPTIGYGTNLTTSRARENIESLGLNYEAILEGRQNLSEEQASKIMYEDMEDSIATSIEIFPNYSEMPNNVRLVLPDMIYNLGETRFRKFKKTIEAIRAGDYETAADEMVDSKWYHQTGNRSRFLVQLMRTASQSED